jgi:hypothetical protein
VAELQEAASARLYLVIRPRDPLALAILDGFSPDDLIQLMSLAPGEGPGLVQPFTSNPVQRREMMRDAPSEPSGRGVWSFILGDPAGEAWLDLEPEGLVLALALWGGRNVLDPGPLLAQSLHRLAQRIRAQEIP